MYQTLDGIGTIIMGAVIILFSDRIARVTSALHRRTLRIEFPRAWVRGGVIFVGALLSLHGLLILFRLVAIK